MIANEPTKAGHLSLCAQSTFLILVEKHTMFLPTPAGLAHARQRATDLAYARESI
jgi:hypothetical protein